MMNTKSKAYRLMQFMRQQKVASFYEIAYGQLKNIFDKRSCQVYLSYLTKQSYLSRSRWTTPKGRIYCVRGKERLIIPYAIENKLIPGLTPLFLKLLKERRAISTIELKAEGFDTPEINFFAQKFSRESNLLKIARIENYIVFYLQDRDLQKFKSSNLQKVKKLEVSEWRKRQEKGKYLEDVIARFYELQGFNVRRNVWLTTPMSKEKLEVDVLATKSFFPEFENSKPIIIAVQCKYWTTGFEKEHVITPTTIMLWSSKVREVFPSAICDFWGFHISNNLFKKSLLLNNPFFRVFSSKEINYAFELVQKNRPEIKQEVKT